MEVFIIDSPYSLDSRQYLIFEEALGIRPPWSIKEVRLDRARRRLDIVLDFVKGALFECPECENEATAYDTKIHEWQHLDFFQYETHIYTDIVLHPEDERFQSLGKVVGKVHRIEPDRGFW